MKKLFLLILLIAGVLIAPAVDSYAQGTKLMNYQGRLLDDQLLPFSGNQTILFELYSQETGGTAVWNETQNVDVQRGYFNVYLGINNALDIDFSAPYWLQVTVNGNAYNRTPLSSVPSAFFALVADTAKIAQTVVDAAITQSKLAPGVQAIPWGTAGGDLIGTYPNPTIGEAAVLRAIKPGSITQDKLAPNITFPPSGAAGGDLTGTYPDPLIAAGAVKTDRIFNGAVTTQKIANLAVTNDKLSANAVTTDKIANGTIITEDLANFVVVNINLADNSVDNRVLADDAVNSANIINETILSEDIVDGTIATADLADGSVTNAKLAADAVTTDKIMNETILSEDIVDGTIATADLANLSVTNAIIADDAVTTGKIMNGTILTEDIAADQITNLLMADKAVGVNELIAVTETGASNPIPNSAAFTGSMLYYNHNTADANELRWSNAPTAVGQVLTWNGTTVDWVSSAVVTASPIVGDGTLANPITLMTTNVDPNTILFFDGTAWTTGPITSAMIEDLTVGTLDIADGAITTAKLADAAVTNAKLAADAVNSANIIDGTVANVDLAIDAVHTENILDGEVMTADIADLNVTTDKLADLAVTNAKIADGAVSTAKLADLSVTAGKINSTGIAAGWVLESDGSGGATWGNDGLLLPYFDTYNGTADAFSIVHAGTSGSAGRFETGATNVSPALYVESNGTNDASYAIEATKDASAGQYVTYFYDNVGGAGRTSLMTNSTAYPAGWVVGSLDAADAVDATLVVKNNDLGASKPAIKTFGDIIVNSGVFANDFVAHESLIIGDPAGDYIEILAPAGPGLPLVFDGNVDINGTLNVDGATTLTALTAGNTSLLSANVITNANVGAALTVGGTLGVTGATTLADLTAANSSLLSATVITNATVGADLNIGGNISILGNYTSTNGNITLVNGVFTGNGSGLTDLSVAALPATVVLDTEAPAAGQIDGTFATGLNVVDGSLLVADLNGAAFANWDTDFNNDLTTTTNFLGGDVSGLWNNLQLGAGVVGQTELAADAVISSKILDGSILLADVNAASFGAWDQNAANDLTDLTVFAGDVTGTYNATVVADDSHLHTAATLPATTTFLGNTIDLTTEVVGVLPAANLPATVSYLGTAIDLGTAEVAGTLPATAVGTGLTDLQVDDNITVNNTTSVTTTGTLTAANVTTAGTVTAANLTVSGTTTLGSRTKVSVSAGIASSAIVSATGYTVVLVTSFDSNSNLPTLLAGDAGTILVIVNNSGSILDVGSGFLIPVSENWTFVWTGLGWERIG